MNPYIFVTDSDSDLPYEIMDERQIAMVFMPYVVNGEEYADDLGRSHGQKEYFNAMRNGSVPSTSCLPTAYFVDFFDTYLQGGNDILYLSFSSQLSANIQNVYAACEELKTKYPNQKIVVVDTLSISAPQSILIEKAHDLYRAGKSIDEVAQWVETNKLRAQAWFTVDDLKYLRRGGRISSFAATMGTVLDLKPIIVETKEGKLESVEKIQGRKRALRAVANKVAENIDKVEEADMVILHADALEDAQRLEKLIRERVPALHNIRTQYVGPVIGAHCGPGTIAACFFGKVRPH